MTRQLQGRLRRGGLAVALAVAIIATLLAPGRPAVAEPTDNPLSHCSRTTIALAWQTGGPQVEAAARQALLGTDADLCAFADKADELTYADQTIAANQMLAQGGPTVRSAVTGVLDSDDRQQLTAFLATGWQQPWEADQEIRINQMVADGGPQLRAVAQKALDDDSPAELQTFLESGWQEPYQADQELKINQIMATGGPEVRQAAGRALDAGTLDAYTRFLTVDWGVAAARDHEQQTLTDLLQEAKESGVEAATQTQAAKDEATRAVTEAEAAKKAAIVARDAANAAHNDRLKAEKAAQSAAAAAAQAAKAATQAVAAANDAAAAAREAAAAALRVAAAAAYAERKASEAYNAAAAARTDRQAADRARTAAQAARDAAKVADTANASLQQAQTALAQAKSAGNSALSAKGQSDAAEAAARQAADAANAAGADTSEAVAAANRARAASLRASRAAQATITFATIAATEATEAGKAAKSAAADAVRAAAAAEDAAAHAGEAADAAKKATEHAKAAEAAANAALAAATQATKVFDAAREADKERLQVSYEQGVEAAREAARQVTASAPALGPGYDAPMAEHRSAALTAKITKAADPQTPRATAVQLGREAAMELSTSPGSFTKDAAFNALTGDDDLVLQFVRTGLQTAEGMDDRTTLAGLMSTGTQAMQAAAKKAANGTDAEVAAFLKNPTYPEQLDEDTIEANRILAAAQKAGDQHTADAARHALDDGTAPVLRAFIKSGQYDARSADAEIKTNQIYADAPDGSELKDAAEIALEGPPAFRTQFLEVGRYQAQLHDQDAAAHLETVSELVTQIQEVAYRALQNSFEAQAAAATARGAAAEAAGYADDAIHAAKDAAGDASAANAAAARAADSAHQAADSARTAINASQSAATSADQAAQSATWAQISAARAHDYAIDAIGSANEARRQAVAAGQSAQQAVAAFSDALDSAYQQAINPILRTAADATATCYRPFLNPPGYDQACLQRIADNTVGTIEDPAQLALQQGSLCQNLYERGSDQFNSCISDVLSPTFEDDVAYDAINGLLAALQEVAKGLIFFELNVAALRFCVSWCSDLLAELTPDLIGAFPPGLLAAAQGATGLGLLSARIADYLEEARVAVSANKGSTSWLEDQSFWLNGSLSGFRDLGGGQVVSPGGLVYDLAPKSPDLHRVLHVLQHLLPDPRKKIHGIFALDGDPVQLFALLDEAWKIRGKPTEAGVWIVDMHRVIGTEGQTRIKIITQASKKSESGRPGAVNEIVTAFPWF